MDNRATNDMPLQRSTTDDDMTVRPGDTPAVPAEPAPPVAPGEPHSPFAPAHDTTAQSDWQQLLHGDPAKVSPATMRTAVKEILETAIYILLVFVIVRSLVQNFKIEGDSMEPTLHSGQYILVNKLVYFNFDLNAPLRWLPGYDDLPTSSFYLINPPQRGDVVVFEYPNNVQRDYIKRVIGMPGETVEVRDGQVFVDGVPLDEPYLQGLSTSCRPGTACSRGPVTVPADTIFVMGDNRENSSDSREWDALPLHRVIGQAWFLYFPVEDWGLIPHPSYAADEQLDAQLETQPDGALEQQVEEQLE